MKEKAIWKNIRRFKLKSVFVQYYIYILLLAFIMNAIFSVYIYRTHIQNLKNSRETALSAFLTQASEESDNSIQLLYGSILSISKDPLIAKSVVAPSLENSERNAEIAQKLNSNALNFDYINALYLYESTSDMLFTPDEKLALKSASPYRRMIDIFLTDRTPCFDRSIRQEAKLINYEDRLYLVCHFIPSGNDFIGMLAAELNKDKLFAGLSQTLDATDYHMTIRMPDGVLLFDPAKEDARGEGSDASMARVSTVSGLTGWEYTVYAASLANASLGQYLGSILPFLLCMLLISLLISLQVTGYVYSPIHKLLGLVEKETAPREISRSDEDPDTGSRTHSSELDVLSSRYAKLASDNKAAESFILEARPELESRLILDIIHGSGRISPDGIRSQLAILNSSLRTDDRYQCFQVRLSPLEQSEQLVYYMVYLQVRQNLTELFCQNGDRIYFLFFHDETFALAMQYHGDKKESEIRNIQRFLVAELKEQFGDISEGVTIASGSVREGMEGLPVSYYEAKEELRKRIYYGQENADTDTGTDSGIQTREDISGTYLARIDRALDEERPEDIRSIAGQMLEEILLPGTDHEIIYRCCSGLIDLLLGKISAFPAGSGTDNLAEYRGIYRQIGSFTELGDLHSFMQAQTDRLVSRLVSEYGRRQHKIIARAREYIQLHYADSSISIRDIADAAGVTDSYLSSLFTEYTGESLVTYLNSYRVDMAKELLLNTNIIIKDVGYKTGFYTIQNFNRVFKRVTGITPGEYRKQNKTP